MPGARPCSGCGTPVPAGARFCARCGTAASTTDDMATRIDTDAPQIPCSACGGPLSPDDNFCPSCGTAPTEADTVASDVSLSTITARRLAKATAGEFEILQQIGHGAMGSVYLARDVALSRRVAIKVVSPALLLDETMIARFRLEARTVASLRHPNIVSIFGVRQFSDLHFFVMDFIDGASLGSILRSQGRLDIAVVQALLFEVGSALGYAHRRGRGVIHRDVKPANIMVDREGHAIVTDFGISKVGASTSGLTRAGSTIGTPEYMSPEQCRDQELSGASDQYALGIVAYEMLCGEVPFKGSHYNVMAAHAGKEPPPIRAKRPDCPEAVEDAVMRMLRKSPAERWPDLDSAVAALGGHPLGPRDPVRAMIVELAESVIGTTMLGLDTASPLSPVPGLTEKTDGPVAVSISGVPEVVEEGDTFRLQAEVVGASGSVLPLADVVWSTSDPSILTVEGGTVKALSAGSASITATAGPVANTVIVTVRPPRVAKVSVLPSSIRIEAGGRISLTASVEDRRGVALQRPVRWMSDADQFVSVSDRGPGTGEAIALAPGTTRITAEVEGITGTAEVIVEEPRVRRIRLSAVPESVEVGDEFRLEASVGDAWDNPLDREIVWESDAGEVVTVDGGRVTAVGPGSGRIKATCEGKSATVLVKVSPAAVASIEISGMRGAAKPGDRFEVGAVPKDRRGNALEREVVWSSSDASVATISADGAVLAVGPGDVSFLCRSGDVERSVAMTVAAPPVAKKTSEADSAVEVSAVPRSVGRKRRPSTPARKGPSEEKPTVASTPRRRSRGRRIGAVLVLLAVLVVGQRIVRNRLAGVEGIPSVDVVPAADTLETGDSLRLVTRVRNARGETVDGSNPVWISSDSAVATVDTDGLVIARAPGPVTIRALLDGVETAAEILVRTPPPVAAAAPDPEPVRTAAADTLPVGSTPTRPTGGGAARPPRAAEVPPPRRVASVDVLLQATSMQVGSAQTPGVRVQDESGGDLPTNDFTATWRSTDPSVLAVASQGGPLSARGPGQAYVVASVDGVSDSVLVRVDAVVAEVRIEGGDLSLEVGAFAPVTATALDASGRALADEPIQWRSSNPLVASVRAGGGRVNANRAGTATIIASSGDVEGRLSVTVAARPPAAPTRVEARAELERYLALLNDGDEDAVRSLLGGAGEERRHQWLLDRLDEPGFAAELLGMGEPVAIGSGATVGFRIRMRWRSFTGARRERTVEFRASLDPAPAGWRLSRCVLAPDAGP